jgi:hypothetical protein
VQHSILDASVAFLQKPFSSLVLARKVRQVLDAPQPVEKPVFSEKTGF